MDRRHGRAAAALTPCAVLAVAWLGASCGPWAGPNGSANPGSAVRILVDTWHSHKQNPTISLNPDDYGYSRMHGYSRLFRHLLLSGYGYDLVAQPLTDTLLARYQILFINLVDDTRPGFEASEIDAIEAFVARGGGLLIITDHSNCYHSAQIINPVLARFALRATYYTAVERGPDNAIEGGGWLNITRFAAHPVTEGLRRVSFQTGGTIEASSNDATVLAWSSENAFGDFWNESQGTPGYYGNWRQDSGEPDGPLALAVAREWGQGRVVVVTDQNVFGDVWLHYADNYRFALNAFQWLGRDRLPAEEETLRFRVLTDESSNGSRAGRKAPADGFYTFYTVLNRHADFTVHADYGLTEGYDALLLLAPAEGLSAADLALIDAYLATGRDVVLILNEQQRQVDASRALLEHLAGDVKITGATASRVVSAAAVHGDGMLGETATVESWCRIRATGGRPWLWIEDGAERYDIARAYDSHGGRAIIYFQSAFWRNAFLGDESAVPTHAQREAWRLAWLMLQTMRRAG
ncbi:MAG TPA: hypothetical protein PLD23_19080 [Armatimonadota bacterium]|nr:hypothetical protein [Armatimonadota bacterium]